MAITAIAFQIQFASALPQLDELQNAANINFGQITLHAATQGWEQYLNDHSSGKSGTVLSMPQPAPRHTFSSVGLAAALGWLHP
jgi:hypothetical protein